MHIECMDGFSGTLHVQCNDGYTNITDGQCFGKCISTTELLLVFIFSISLTYTSTDIISFLHTTSQRVPRMYCLQKTVTRVPSNQLTF